MYISNVQRWGPPAPLVFMAASDQNASSISVDIHTYMCLCTTQSIFSLFILHYFFPPLPFNPLTLCSSKSNISDSLWLLKIHTLYSRQCDLFTECRFILIRTIHSQTPIFRDIIIALPFSFSYIAIKQASPVNISKWIDFHPSTRVSFEWQFCRDGEASKRSVVSRSLTILRRGIHLHRLLGRRTFSH